jgi:superfamily I DNA/RNA helicase
VTGPLRRWPDQTGLTPPADVEALVADVARGIRQERAMGMQPVPLVVATASPEPGTKLWRLEIDADELEEGAAWMAAKIGPAPLAEGDPWTAVVVEVDATAMALFVDPGNTTPWPGPAELRPFDFLESPWRLVTQHPTLHGALAGRLVAARGQVCPTASLPAVNGAPEAWRFPWSMVWGPPGTGKTHTLVHGLHALLRDPDERVLVLSTTRRATDEVALRLGALRIAGLRGGLSGVLRVGPVANRQRFEEDGLTELLPQLSDELRAQIAEAEARLYQARTALDRAEARRHLEQLRSGQPGLRDHVLNPDVRCLITTVHSGLRAVILPEVVEMLQAGSAPFTTVLVDEAGLVSRAASAALSLLAARRFVLVGDPRQLSPISRAARSLPRPVATWIARSALDHLADHTVEPHVHRLLDQRRMRPPIRAAVSALAYGEALRDAPEVLTRPAGKVIRGLPAAAWLVLDAMFSPAEVASCRGPNGRSRERPALDRVLDDLFAAHPALVRAHGLILSPYRAQCARAREWLTAHKVRTWSASTIHQQQGAEADVVVLDTVAASSTSWPAQEWVRLVNVGLSRAREHIVLVASRAELAQPWLRPIRPHLEPLALVHRADGWAWETPEAEAPSLFAPAAEPGAAGWEPPAETLGAQIAARAALRPILSMEQARLVHRELSDAGPRLVRGVAGSGKTLVLAHWAVRALSGLGVPEVGVVYTNRALRPLLEHMLASAWSEQRPNAGAMPWSRVHLVYLQDLLVSLLADRELPDAGYAGDANRYDYEHQAQRILAAGPVEPRFPALLVDEAQDAGDAPLRVLAGLVEPGPDGRRALMMFYDNAQNVFGRTRPQWRELGVDLRGRSDVMRESFRTTRAISELALNLLGQLSPLENDPDLRELMRATGHDALPLLQHDGRAWRARFCSVAGERPEVTVFDSREQEQAAVVEAVCRWIHREAVSPGAVRVVTQSKSLRQDLLRALRGHGFRVEHRTHEGFGDCDDAVVITTPHSFKGYDAEVVVVPGIDRFAPQGNLLTAPLYVALTRARTVLWATATVAPPGSAAAALVGALQAADRALG